MSKTVIYAITILGLCMYSSSIENKCFSINQIVHSVAGSYKALIQSSNLISKIAVRIAIGAIMLFILEFSYERSLAVLEQDEGYRILLLTLFQFIILSILLYFIFGIPLLIFSKIECLIKTIQPNKLSYRFLVTTYILFMYSCFLYTAKETLASCGSIVLLGLLVSYILNMTMLIHISMEPVSYCLCKYGSKNKIEQKYPLKVVLAGALILIILIVLNLFLGVVMITLLYDHAYVNVTANTPVSIMDLLYYTVISFTTIGYGEIVPRRLESKIMAILIACTSVMCLVIFVSSILALKEKRNG